MVNCWGSLQCIFLQSVCSCRLNGCKAQFWVIRSASIIDTPLRVHPRSIRFRKCRWILHPLVSLQSLESEFRERHGMRLQRLPRLRLRRSDASLPPVSSSPGALFRFLSEHPAFPSDAPSLLAGLSDDGLMPPCDVRYFLFVQWNLTCVQHRSSCICVTRRHWTFGHIDSIFCQTIHMNTSRLNHSFGSFITFVVYFFAVAVWRIDHAGGDSWRRDLRPCDSALLASPGPLDRAYRGA